MPSNGPRLNSLKAPHVFGLFQKIRRGHPMEAAQNEQLEFTVGSGIVGDENRHPMSPRQVLVTRLEDLKAFNIAPGQLRENLVIEGLDELSFVPGTALTFPDGTRLRLTFYCEPCKRIAHLVPTLKQIYLRRGILGVVLAGGTIRIGDEVRSEIGAFEPLSLFPYDRFISFIVKVPNGRVITYKDVIAGMGVADSYFRAIPSYLKRAEPSYPLHRIVDSEGCLVPYVLGQRDLLAREGVCVQTNTLQLFTPRTIKLHEGNSISLATTELGRVDLALYRWKDATVYLK